MGNDKDTKIAEADPRSVPTAEVGSIREYTSLHVDGLDPVFENQARLVNHAVQVIGMGKYQWALFGLCGYGWLCDQLWQTTISDALTQVALEFNPKHSAFLSLALIAGLVVGASFWGLGCDLIGRRLAFNLTLLIAGVFGTAAGAANSFISCAVLVSFCGFGVGGNLPVDSAVFLEFLPGTHQYLLEILALWWAIGLAIPAGAAWGFLPRYSCASDTPAGQCKKADNMGWRYLMYTMGAITLFAFFLRFFLFRLRESPRYLIGQGRYQEAIDVLNDVAKYNGTTQPLTVEDLIQVERDFAESHNIAPVNKKTAVKRTLAQFRPGGLKHIRALFASKKLAYSMVLILLVWGMIGLASPLYSNFLPEYLALHGAQSGSDSINITYRNNFIILACTIPGTLIAGWLIGLPYIGRRGTLGLSLILTSVFLFAFTRARTQAQILAFNCVSSFVQYIMWGALYCYTPEVIPSIHRGTGTGLAAAFNRICGLMAPIIATYVGYTNTPIYVSASLYIVAGLLSFLFPYETSGKASL
ncbi:MFS general substrate transporter [Exophiala viscosa]|uniref:MFS general substrate transporter n=1 Tax=Exophiala viscosa TaxID=2486360 RepID=A0AAN6IAF6_9EURO|nr:MFS general substrate transporter [Exophiala viscosa]